MNKKQLILVEDDPDIIIIYQTVLSSGGFDVEVLSSGQDVLKKMKSVEAGEVKAPDLVLLDLILPDMNGTEVLSFIKKNPKTKDITVFILTNQQESEMPVIAGVKPDKFIIKANITPSELLEVVKKELK